MTESFNFSLYRLLPEDTVLLLDNINTAEELATRAHRLTPDGFTIYFVDVERVNVHAKYIRCRVVLDKTTIQWRDPFHTEFNWQVLDLEDVRRVQAHWDK
jgi:hypothetical protein